MSDTRGNWQRNIYGITITLLGALLTSQCSTRVPSASSITQVPPPVISSLNMSHPSNEMFYGEEVEMWVNAAIANRNITPTYVWSIEGGEITKGQGTENITYRAPDTPGTYRVRLKIEYGDWSTERSTPIVVVSPKSMRNPPTPTSTATPASIPIDTITPSPTPVPTSTHTPTATRKPTSTHTPTATPTSTSTSTPTTTPTPTPYPPTALDEPEDGVLSEGRLPPLSWNWERELAEEEYFEVRIWREGEPYHAGIVWVKRSPFDFNLKGFPTGKYFWSIAVMRGEVKSKGWPGMDAWEGIDPVSQLSEESDFRSFFLSIDIGKDKANDCQPFCP